jgi:hypothetical protein
MKKSGAIARYLLLSLKSGRIKAASFFLPLQATMVRLCGLGVALMRRKTCLIELGF